MSTPTTTVAHRDECARDVANLIPGLTVKQSREYLDTVLDVIKTRLANGDKVVFREFGSFTLNATKPRQGRNVVTGEAVPIPARKAVKFKMSEPWRDELSK